MVQLFWGQFFEYVFEANVSYSFPIHFLFIPFWFIFISIHVLFIFIHFFSFPLTCEIYQNSKKQGSCFLISLLFKNYWFQAPNQLGKGVPHKSPQKWLVLKGAVNKVLGLDGLFISYSILIHFLFNSFPERRGKESKCSQWSNPESWVQYICQYKIQPIVPNTFSNKESIAHKDSVHNLLEKVFSLYSIVWGGRGGGRGLLITFPHEGWK